MTYTMCRQSFVSILLLLGCVFPVSAQERISGKSTGVIQSAIDSIQEKGQPELPSRAVIQSTISSVANELMKEVPPLEKPFHLKICIFDIMGRNGPVFSIAQDVALEAKRWNVHAELLPFNNESVAANSFKVGACDAVGMSTLRARSYNFFMGSFDAVGALMTYEEVKTAISVLMGSDKMYARSINHPYQVVGMAPLGAAYVMVNDRAINSLEKAAGKKVAVLEWDSSQAKMVQQIGAQPVASDISNFAQKFNNGVVDIIAAPALAYGPFELYRGLGTKGAVFNLPLGQVTGSAVINRTKFEKEIPDLDDKIKKLRKFGLRFLDQGIEVIKKLEKTVPERYWMTLEAQEKIKYMRMMDEARAQLTAEGVYHPEMMTFLMRVRCRHSPTLAECAALR
ncbi:MAG TPA: putative solute-binding protein [Limnobacter sp.]|nr:putative solute-binding protein [Limnobacter sp.]